MTTLTAEADIDQYLGDERNRQIAAMTRQGVSAVQIATHLHISARQVQRLRRKLGCSLGDPPILLTADEKRRALDLFDDGCSVTDVARTLGGNPSTIAKNFPGRAWTRQQAMAHARSVRDMAWLMRQPNLPAAGRNRLRANMRHWS